ncbi:MAG: hypothetical protein AVDCRST_MAG52-442, partial [uncultured Blastococcus sp.]
GPVGRRDRVRPGAPRGAPGQDAVRQPGAGHALPAAAGVRRRRDGVRPAGGDRGHRRIAAVPAARGAGDRHRRGAVPRRRGHPVAQRVQRARGGGARRDEAGDVVPARGRDLLRRPVRRRVGRPVAAGHRRARRPLRRAAVGVRRRLGRAARGLRPGGVPGQEAGRPAADRADPPRGRGAVRRLRGVRGDRDRPRAHRL